MKLLIDDARTHKIRALMEYFPIDGVTTNPGILAAAGRPPFEVLKEIRGLIGPDMELHVQVISETAEGMLEEAKRIREELGADTFVKIPVTREGLKAIAILAKEGVRVTATTIYTRMQAYLAAKAGASYAAPYVNRIDNLGEDGAAAALDMQQIFRANGYGCELLAASFKNARQVMALCMDGADAATVSPDVLEAMVKNDSVAAAVADFKAAYEGLCGEGVTMNTCG